MMTNLEMHLLAGDFAWLHELRSQLVQAQGEVKRSLLKGGQPQQYSRWQQEATAIQAGLTIIKKLTGE